MSSAMAPTLVESFSTASKKPAIAMASPTLPCEPSNSQQGQEKVVTTDRVKCPGCQWTMLLTTLHKDQDKVILHFQQAHGLAPVRQVEDSEDKVAEDISNQEVITTVIDLAQDHQMDSVRGQVPHP